MPISALFALLVLAQPAASDTIAARMQTLADSVLRVRPRVPGIVIHVESTRDGRRWTVAAGQSDTARDTPMRPQQLFRIASVTKTYVAAGILRLVERGVISLRRSDREARPGASHRGAPARLHPHGRDHD
jgi:D-alanyl-D-alanine carboxypeptidase